MMDCEKQLQIAMKKLELMMRVFDMKLPLLDTGIELENYYRILSGSIQYKDGEMQLPTNEDTVAAVDNLTKVIWKIEYHRAFLQSICDEFLSDLNEILAMEGRLGKVYYVDFGNEGQENE